MGCGCKDKATKATQDPQKPQGARNKRLELCESCDSAMRTLGRLRCRECGCFMEIKATMPASKCPLGKW